MEQLLWAGVVLACCVLVHAGMMALLLRWLRRLTRRDVMGAWLTMRVLVGMAWWMIVAHVIEVSIWAACYAGQRVFDDFTTAMYFSFVTYTTVGYGDTVPPESWRLAAGIEGLTGILLCGLSGALFFAAMVRIHGRGDVDRS